jgi:hypothetical protein
MRRHEMNEYQTVFIPISDVESYCDWDDEVGYGGMDQIIVEGGIVVLKEKEEGFKEHIKRLESYMVKDEDEEEEE